MKATNAGRLVPIEKCVLVVPGFDDDIVMRILPDISDQKGANYVDEPVMGRSSPPPVYSHSEKRSIGVTFHYFSESSAQAQRNLQELRAIQSACYPRSDSGDAPFSPPPICTFKCGQILADNSLCVILRNYSVKYLPDVPWDENTLMPIKFDIDTSWDVVYKVVSLPGAERIVSSGG